MENEHMKTAQLNTAKANTIVSQADTSRKTFEQAKRNFEAAFRSGGDYAAELLELSHAIAAAVLKKVIDPQRKTAAQRDTVSNSGYNPALVDLRRDLFRDMHQLATLRDCADRESRTTYNAEGDAVTEVVDKDAAAAVEKLIADCLGDGIDLVQEAAAALLEQAADHATAGDWLDTPYTTRRLDKRVYLQAPESAAVREEETTPAQEVYRAIRRLIQNSRAVQTDPRNKYCYVSLDHLLEGDENALDHLYLRLGKCADLGGYVSTIDGGRDYSTYTADFQTAADMSELIERLNLSRRESDVLSLLLRGAGQRAAASYLGITDGAVSVIVSRIRNKCRAAFPSAAAL